MHRDPFDTDRRHSPMRVHEDRPKRKRKKLSASEEKAELRTLLLRMAAILDTGGPPMSQNDSADMYRLKQKYMFDPDFKGEYFYRGPL